MGQGIGMSIRGLKPIAEIQYLDYILYCIQILSDDLATLSYRTKGRQLAPLIIRTRGHRLEGIWHSGSPMGGLINLTRGVYLLVPRNMTQAADASSALVSAMRSRTCSRSSATSSSDIPAVGIGSRICTVALQRPNADKMP